MSYPNGARAEVLGIKRGRAGDRPRSLLVLFHHDPHCALSPEPARRWSILPNDPVSPQVRHLAYLFAGLWLMDIHD